jgi:hypothetical protein
MELYQAFPNVSVSLLERFDEATLQHITGLLGVELPVPEGLVGRDHQASALKDAELVPVLQPYHACHDECAAIYAEITGAFSPTTLRYDHTWHQRQFVEMVTKRCTSLLEDVMRSLEVQDAAAA